MSGSKLQYVVFKTSWGFFGLAGTGRGLVRTALPMRNRGDAEKQLLRGLSEAHCDSGYLGSLQQQIRAYFEGAPVDFSGVAVVLEGFSPFAGSVLRTCRRVTYGQTISYGELAEKAGRAGAARAVGRIMAQNRLPLIIPCHRVIRADGRFGGFSAQGGVKLKEKLLRLEQHAR